MVSDFSLISYMMFSYRLSYPLVVSFVPALIRSWD